MLVTSSSTTSPPPHHTPSRTPTLVNATQCPTPWRLPHKHTGAKSCSNILDPLRWGESARCDVGREEPCVTTTHMLAHDREVAVSEPCVPSSSASCCSNSLGTERLLVPPRVISHSAFQHKGMLTKQQIFGKPCYSLTFFTSIFASHILY
jgi:hypothetical protein